MPGGSSRCVVALWCAGVVSLSSLCDGRRVPKPLSYLPGGTSHGPKAPRAPTRAPPRRSAFSLKKQLKVPPLACLVCCVAKGFSNGMGRSHSLSLKLPCLVHYRKPPPRSAKYLSTGYPVTLSISCSIHASASQTALSTSITPSVDSFRVNWLAQGM